MSAFTQRLLHRKLELVAMVVLVGALAGGNSAGAVLGSGSGSPPAEPEAVIINTTPFVVQLAPPPASILAGPLASFDDIFAFDEQQGIVLGAPLHVDLLGAPGASVPPVPAISGDIPTGTVVNTHFIHRDSLGGNSAFGTVTFERDIAGVIFTHPGLDGTDTLLGVAGTTYPTGIAGRAPEVGLEDNFTISADKRTLTADLGTAILDQVRVITLAPAQGPPPGTGDGTTGPDPLPRMPSFQQQLDILSGDGVLPELVHSAIEQLPGMLLSPPVVLPTSGGQVTMETWMETQRFAKRTALDLQDAIKALTDVKMGPNNNPDVRAHANQVSVLLEATLSVIQGLKGQVMGVDPAGTIHPHLRTYRSKIEGPFLPLAPMRFAQFSIERTEVCNIDSGESNGGGSDAGGLSAVPAVTAVPVSSPRRASA